VKLLFCPTCKDIFNLTYESKRCKCGCVQGQYESDGLHAIYSAGIPLCFSNNSFNIALEEQLKTNIARPEEFYGARFEAWICPVSSDTFVRK